MIPHHTFFLNHSFLRREAEKLLTLYRECISVELTQLFFPRRILPGRRWTSQMKNAKKRGEWGKERVREGGRGREELGERGRETHHPHNFNKMCLLFIYVGWKTQMNTNWFVSQTYLQTTGNCLLKSKPPLNSKHRTSLDPKKTLICFCHYRFDLSSLEFVLCNHTKCTLLYLPSWA